MPVYRHSSIRDDIDAINRIPVISKILEVICRTTGMGFAAVARVTDRQWVACAIRDEIQFGLEVGGELVLETTICHEIRQSGKHVVIDHVDKDDYYRTHHTPLQYGFQSYISVPIFMKDGSFFGTLCSIDPRPALVSTPEVTGMFQLFAELIAFHLSAIEEHQVTESELEEEREVAVLREEFVAILGHDLRNPVQASLNGAQLLLQMPLDATGARLAHIIQNSAYRMKSLIENMLDFARGRLGGGIIVHREPETDLEPMLTAIVNELRIVWPARTIILDVQLEVPVNCDSRRVAQLFSNLLGNALSYGEKDKAVTVVARALNGFFRLTVGNPGKKISSTIMHRLFQPFSRTVESANNREGLGLGLYIASEIAKAHGGTLEVSSTDEETSFTFQMPVGIS